MSSLPDLKMDELTDLLGGALQVTKSCNSTFAPHPRYSMYKAKTTKQSQEERRKRILEMQKERRFDFVSLARKLADGTVPGNYSESGSDESTEVMDCSVFRKPHSSYKDRLMMSEWLDDVPCDFEEEWVMVPCPVGKRCLLVASNCSTKIYARNGHYISQFQSAVPGGRPAEEVKLGYSMLDCVWSTSHKCYYVLDVLCWNCHGLFDCETEFRFYWLENKFLEHPGLTVRSRINRYPILPLPYYTCKRDELQAIVNSATFPPFLPKIDGLLFYHKRAHYNSGSTPLVGWLKMFMLPGILDIPVPAEYTNQNLEVAARKRVQLKEQGKTEAEIRIILRNLRKPRKTKVVPPRVVSMDTEVSAE